MRAAIVLRGPAWAIAWPEIAALAACVGALAALTAGALDERAQIAFAAAAVAAALPHGAADLPLARALLAPKLGPAWLPAFLFGYLSLALAVLAAWRLAPATALAAFLAISAVHFGLTDKRPGEPVLPAMLGRGGAPLLVPALAYPDMMAAIFASLAGEGGVGLVGLMRLPVAPVWAFAAAWTLKSGGRPAAELLLVAACFVLLPPLLAFAIYFGLLHAPRALRRTAGEAGMGVGALLRAGAPATAAALALLVGGYAALRVGLDRTDAALSALFVGLAALTVPHMGLELLAQRLTGKPRS